MIEMINLFFLNPLPSTSNKQKCFECGWASSINNSRNKSSNDMDRSKVECDPSWGFANRIYSLWRWSCQAYLVPRRVHRWYSRFKVPCIQSKWHIIPKYLIFFYRMTEYVSIHAFLYLYSKLFSKIQLIFACTIPAN